MRHIILATNRSRRRDVTALHGSLNFLHRSVLTGLEDNLVAHFIEWLVLDGHFCWEPYGRRTQEAVRCGPGASNWSHEHRIWTE